MNRHLRKLLRPCMHGLARWAAQSYVAGPELADAMRVCGALSKQGIASTVCFWNVESDAPRMVADAYLAALGMMASKGLHGHVAIKAPAVGYASDLVTEVMERGRDAGVGIHFDSLAPDAADRTLALIAQSIRRYPSIGCTVPGRWQRSPDDADRAVELGARVRVVKGQWADPNRDVDLRDGFLAVIDRLAGRARYVGVASHDPPLAREALRRLRAAGTACELELLFGLPLKAPMQVARDAGVPVRLYIPYGTAWLPYCLTQVRKNPWVLWWIARDAVFGRFLHRLVMS